MSNDANFYTQAFERNEGNYNDTKDFLTFIYDKHSHSFRINEKNYPIGQLTTPTLEEARKELKILSQDISASANISASSEIGNAYDIHQKQNGANVIMVASQFNLLEFVSQFSIPENGITGYCDDKTQGPACAMAAPFATAYRNYLAETNEGKITQESIAKIGQSEDNQINTLGDTMKLLNASLEASGNKTSNQSTKFSEPIPDGELLFFKNGYIDSTNDNLIKLNKLIQDGGEEFKQKLKDSMRVGIHRDVLIADTKDSENPVFKTQVLASAIPVARGYSSVTDSGLWEPFARLVLEAQYEHTILEGLRDNAMRIKEGKETKPILLTALGGGVFDNKPEWIKESMALAVEKAGDYGIPFEVSINYFDENAKNQWGDVSFLQPAIAKAKEKIGKKIEDQKVLEHPSAIIEEGGFKQPTYYEITFNLVILKSLNIIATAIRDNDHESKPVVNYYVSHGNEEEAKAFSQRLRTEYGITGRGGENKYPVEQGGEYKIILTPENINQIQLKSAQQASPTPPSLEASQKAKTLPALINPEEASNKALSLKAKINHDVLAGEDKDSVGNPVINYKIEFDNKATADAFSLEIMKDYDIKGQSGKQKYSQPTGDKFCIILTERDVDSILRAPSKSSPPAPAPASASVSAELGFVGHGAGGAGVVPSIAPSAPPSRDPAPVDCCAILSKLLFGKSR
jgi:hypothetical protein